ncbi:pleckstrin homology domain-containing family D member 1-like isoform X2 [Ruditapes philippinarum]|uniref:pleckstrin homology domain-containing family D member 1-like isoform X2 n=1 Tax=Ruditapes philippinarum TaxID=129788 RepID=UPI00295C3837|nr:pleckstrin homology domain-containing family D member 1-like isoform X2 [Ruditapes philippinarum]
MTCLCEKLFVKHYGIDMNGMPEHADNLFDWKNRQQIHGVLLKRSNAQSKWMRRFFIVRDGWMFYYPETEKKEFPRRNFFNTAPKAAIPLGVCNITVSNKEQGQPSAFIISSEEIEGNLTLAAENDYERDKWISVLEKSKRITWANQQMSDDLIRQLEEHGLTLAKQKQDYFDRLQSEVLELADEKEKTWELERLNEELEKEKAKMESFAEEMKTDYEKVKNELEDMQSYMKSLDTERLELREQLTTQETDLKALATEKESIEATLKRQESVTEQISHEKEQISHEKEKISHEKEQTEEQMKTKLRNIEEQTQILLQEKAEAEMRLQENEQRARELEEEKTMYNEQAQELQSTIKDLTVQKEMTENELKEEIMARMEAERRLKNAESSLHKLHHAVENETPNIESEVKQEMVVNVNKLKAFFENLAQEAKLDPDKPVVMKNSIHARKTIMRRNKTRKFERRKSSNESMSSHDTSFGTSHDTLLSCDKSSQKGGYSCTIS